jgi:hypothetical protein
VYNSNIISSGVALIFVNRLQTIECSAATSANTTKTFAFSNTFCITFQSTKGITAVPRSEDI